MLHRIAATIQRYGMFRRGQAVGVAVSGGADSICLLHALLELAPQWDLRLHVLHLNHGLRGAESRQDAEFVRDLAARLGLPATIREADPAAFAGNLEQACREARLAFFREAIAGGIVERIALGHTRSDQAETVLFRFLRGAGAAGLAGIRPVTGDGLVRPLLALDRSAVERFLRRRAIPWREDSTNSSPRFARNRIRHGLLPQLAREWNPAIGEALAHTAEWALAEESYWEAEIDRLAAGCLSRRGDAVFLQTSSLKALPVASSRRLVRRAIEWAKGDLRGIGFKHVVAILETACAAPGHGRVQVPGLDVLRSFDWLRFAVPPVAPCDPGGYHLPATVPGSLRLPGCDLEISLELIEIKETSSLCNSVYNSGMGCLNWSALSGSMELRNWRPGDRYQPSGSARAEKIKTLFQRARIPVWERCRWPVLLNGSTIVWSRRFGPSAQTAADARSRVVLQVRETEIA